MQNVFVNTIGGTTQLFVKGKLSISVRCFLLNESNLLNNRGSDKCRLILQIRQYGTDTPGCRIEGLAERDGVQTTPSERKHFIITID